MMSVKKAENGVEWSKTYSMMLRDPHFFFLFYLNASLECSPLYDTVRLKIRGQRSGKIDEVDRRILLWIIA